MLSRPRRPGPSRHAAPPATLPVQVIDHIPLPAALLDARGCIEVLNQAWEEASRPGGLIASTDAAGSDYIHELRDEKGFNLEAGRGLADVIESVLDGQRATARHAYAVEVDGEQTAWEVTVSRIESGDEIHVLVVHRDRNDEAEAQAMRARVDALSVEREGHHAAREDRLQRIHRAQQEFHGPMTPVRLQLHLLRTGRLGDVSDRQAAALDQIERNVQRLWTLQEQLLTELSALEEPGEAQRTDLSALFEEALHPFRERCILAGVRLRVDRTDQGLPVHVDVRAMGQALLVLLDHAIRATPAGGLVWVRLREVGGRAEIAIQDQDPAMDAATADALLSDEEVIEHPLRAVLHHVRAVLERHQGRLRTHCAGAGQGLEVALRLPID